ncbi:unnamed protein product [Soboliphyme baturini]|uniref:DNK domain-containing protein n=1 Tax=Soboliphyme baturini TaxID=241478 RepID=A0A183J8X8_9BILA|nr:unnamed protein product [Soboliphyme baturini]
MVLCAIIRQGFVWTGGSFGKLRGCISSMVSLRTVSCKEVYVRDPNLPAPWPYKERGYRLWYSFFDWTTKRFDENSKLFVVEGNIGSEKSKFARELADKFGFHFIPAPSLDEIFIDSYGVDRRKFYHLIPESCREFDARLFYENPTHPNVAKFQMTMFYCKTESYLNALAHILNTGT